MSAPWRLDDAFSVNQVLTVWRPRLRAGELPDRSAVEEALCRVGRCSGPALLAALLRIRALTPATAALAGPTWSMAEFPDAALPHKTWRSIFAMAGFCVDGRRAERPQQPLVLYRGATAARRRMWSWTDDREVAARYAAGHYGRKPGSVWIAVVDPARLLARVAERQEAEWIVDAARLQIRALDAHTAPLDEASS